MPDLPLFVVMTTVWLYWARVGAMVVRARRRSRDLAGLVPEQRREKLMWLVWVPLVVAWMLLPYLATTHADGWLAVPAFARELPWYAALRWLAAAGAVAALVVTLRCQSRMGKNWRMAVSESERGELVTDGLYARIRHPIYAFQVLLMICTAIVVPTAPVLVIVAIHLLLVAMKAANEERFLLATHGPTYAEYLKRTGRFLPRLRVH
jgi:protein-S-isoprenylcysteine O-methyltransferase Ste14